MTSSPDPAGSSGLLLRISITALNRRLDIGVPAQTPLTELLPGFAQSLGELDATLVHGGYRLTRTDGTVLIPTESLLTQGITDGELLTLVAGVDDIAPRVYDDIVEAVGDAVEEQHVPWTPEDSSKTALAASAAFLVVSSLLLLGSQDTTFAILIAAIGATLVLATAAVLDRTGQGQAARVLAMASCSFGAVAGFLAASQFEPVWGWPLALTGLAIAVTGALGLAVVREHREVFLTPIGAGLVFAVAGSIASFFAVPPVGVLALTMALVITVGNGIPWLAVSSTRIKVASPLSDEEIFADPERIDTQDIVSRYTSANRVLISVRASVAVVSLVCAIPVAASGLPGVLLCVLGFLGMVVGTRQTYTRADVLIVMGAGLIGLVITGVVAVVVNPDWRGPLIIVLGATAALTIAFALLTNKVRLGMGRIADGVDLFALCLLLPLGVVVAGLA